jgi:hypothetical protein
VSLSGGGGRRGAGESDTALLARADAAVYAAKAPAAACVPCTAVAPVPGGGARSRSTVRPSAC